MDEFLNQFNMFFHPLMDLNYKHVKDEKMLPRKHIKILTYNIFLRPPPVKNNENDWKDERLADFIKVLDCYDIVCLQEMFGSFNNRKQELIKYANKSGLFFYCDSPSPSFFSKFLVDGGLLILSRFPIVESEFRPFRYSVLSDSLANKGILYAKIKIGECFLNIFNTHLQASYFGSSNYHWEISVKTRLDHINELAEFIKDVIVDRSLNIDEKNDGHVLVMGDFNVDAHNYETKKKIMSLNYEIVEEYKILSEQLSTIGTVVDIFHSNLKFHPYTFGYNGENLKHYDQVLTLKEDYGSFQTLDYIFQIIFNKKCLNQHNYDHSTESLKNNEDSLITLNKKTSLKVSEVCHNQLTSSSNNIKKKNKINVDYTSSEIEHFLVAGKPYQQLSDHFGLSVSLKYE